MTFNHSLKRAGILPKSLQFNPPDKCKEGFKIAKRTGWSYLKLRIQTAHQKIKKLNEQRSDCMRKLSSIISQEHFDALLNVIDHNAYNFSDKVKNRHLRKLTEMGAFGTHSGEEFVDKDRWVINLSNRQLDPDETSALQNGLNFATTPRSIPVLIKFHREH